MCLFLRQVRFSHTQMLSHERTLKREISVVGKEIVTHRQELHSEKSSKYTFFYIFFYIFYV